MALQRLGCSHDATSDADKNLLTESASNDLRPEADDESPSILKAESYGKKISG
ncbi:hypothetical protein DPMN_075437, partial [Dreissena polymorpha]